MDNDRPGSALEIEHEVRNHPGQPSPDCPLCIAWELEGIDQWAIILGVDDSPLIGRTG